ncbi:MAG: mechanosensitive ion channel family protein [Chloroflexi bacterium]|nr:mechanosensitive ion channel family protein [Chloroflexota bacterium]
MNTVANLPQGATSGIIIPLVVFVATLIATFWLRTIGYSYAARWAKSSGWSGEQTLRAATRVPSIFWCIIVSAYLALTVSTVPAAWKGPINLTLGSVLVVSIFMAAMNMVVRLIYQHGSRLGIPRRALGTAANIVRAVVIVFMVLTVVEIWGLPFAPVLLLVVVVLLVGILLLRDVLPDVLSGLQLTSTGNVKVGDHIRLESGEEGEVIEMQLRYTRIRGADQSVAIIPSSRMVRSTIINYGPPVTRAREPFRFETRLQVTELTGLGARNLKELAEILKKSPDSVVYYHTHNFLLEHHFLFHEPANDFAAWVVDVLGDAVLGERLAAVDIFEFPNLGQLRERLVEMMEECLSTQENGRQAPPDREFYFLKSVSMVLPTSYTARNLREFLEALRKISIGSLYFHVFEARLRLGKGLNDFSTWLKDSMGEEELARKIARIDPYTYSLEGLRSLLIQFVEQRIERSSQTTSQLSAGAG